ncbi:shikimate dehydrogenase [Prosthecodimorpha staleyi]|uniref:Shikimate dehydrogenase (NADP(+)) n=1 Tax=Prosthecodimorpha staleyi TaxID=2840188 RepID=A0A947D769_9HYPH|nr:shikimate dehydrogenase [Prosthecodimorpha staleyi]MBT9292350.1 shikimate dehydrogenase [Prosthecodimorpha staleyi]
MSSQERFCLAGVMGQPVLHSRSPMIHGHWFAQYGLKGAYVPLAIPPERLEAALRALPALGFSGCNITLPHKVAAMAVMDEVDPRARRIGAINCVVVRPDGSLYGCNNDGFGYLESVRERFPDWRVDAGPIVVLGAGGGARAVVAALADAGAPEIRLVNRSADHAVALAAEYGGPVKAVDWSRRAEILDDAAMVVNTTTQGMTGQPALDLALDRLPVAALVSDIVYIPLETPLLAAARARGNRTVNGLGMLINQARPAFQAWFGILPEVTPDLRARLEASVG